MPNYDGSGPQGQGPATGRGLGPCGEGRGWRRGGRRGYGRRRFFGFGAPRITAEQEKEILEDEVLNLEEALKAAKERLDQLKNNPTL